MGFIEVTESDRGRICPCPCAENGEVNSILIKGGNK